MKTVKSALTAILADIQEKLPPLLEKKSVRQFEGYSIGFPVDPEKPLLCVRFAGMGDDVNKTLEFDIHAQFPGILEIDVYDYIDAVNEYLDGFDPRIAGYTDGSCSIAAHDNPRTAAVEVFWGVKLTYPKDDCD
ncbi:MAG: hypothetical protein LBU85_08895 [Treponema sp.]|jgi:hypothetical protein|nr:hypothetical protein [Treponema sp.]